MGTFVGHLLPGCFFFLYGAWITYNVFFRYFLSKKLVKAQDTNDKRHSYRSSCSFSFLCCPRFPVEGVLKVILTLIALIGELYTGIRGGAFVNYENAHHITMYFFFMLCGVFDILVSFGLDSPPDMDYICHVMAFSMEGFLFGYHLAGRPPMDVQVHSFLVYAVLLCVLSLSLEMVYKTNVLPSLMRCYFVLLQGSWFIQIGFILFKPLTTPWDQHGPRHMMLITLIFCWHNAGVFLLMMLSGWLIKLRVKKLPITSYYSELMELRTEGTMSRNGRVGNTMSQDEVLRIIDDDSEEEEQL